MQDKYIYIGLLILVSCLVLKTFFSLYFIKKLYSYKQKFFLKLSKLEKNIFENNQNQINLLFYYFNEGKLKNLMKIRRILKTVKILPEKVDGTYKTDKTLKDIEIENASLNSIKNFSLSLKQGEIIFFIGENAENLSDLTKILTRASKLEQGQTYYNGINECQFIDASAFDKIFLAEDNSKLFDFADDFNNITFYDENEYKKELAKSLLKELENYEIDVETKTVLARALYSNANLFVFSNFLTKYSEEVQTKLTKKILELFSDNIVVFLSEYPINAKGLGKICVIENGKIAESGSFELLIRNKGIYYKMREKLPNNR